MSSWEELLTGRDIGVTRLGLLCHAAWDTSHMIAKPIQRVPGHARSPESTTTQLGRRAFLRRAVFGAGALAGVPAIVPSSVLGADGTVPPSSRITIGFVGTGRQCNYANIPGFLREPDAQCVAVCDVDRWRRGKARRQIEDHYRKSTDSGVFRGCAEFTDWRELVARPDIDAVMISTPDHWHALMAVAAMKAGKDVCCEKPLTRNVAEGQAIRAAVARNGRVFRTDSEFRTLRAFHRAAELVRNGKLGTLQRIISATPKDSTIGPQPEMPVPEGLEYDMWLGPAPFRPYTEQRVHPPGNDKGRPGWICIRDYADGMLANWGAHLNDIAMWANNTEHTGPVEVEATGHFPPEGNLWDVIQEFEAHFLFGNGVRLVCKTDKPYLRFEGTEGSIHVTYPSQIDIQPESLLQWKPGSNDVALPYKPSEKRDFLDAVKSRRQPMYDADGGHRVNTLSHLMLAAVQLGRKLRWDPRLETAIDDPAADRLLAPKPMRAPWKLES